MKNGILKNIRRKGQILAFSLLSKETLSDIYSKAIIGYKPNLKDPRTFNEWIQWYKLYYCPTHELISTCSDKYFVRLLLEKWGYGKYLNNLYGVWENVDDIPWKDLPAKFVLKCTHGCAYNIICPDKEKLNINTARKKLVKWMKEDFGKFNLESHYSSIKPRIICEKFLGVDMSDYKFFCINGIAELMYISEGLDHDDTATIAFFDRDGKPAKFHRNDYAVNTNAVIPDEFYELRQLSEQLSKAFPFVRVDWFIVNGQVYFSEFTFAPCAGMMQFEPKEYDHEMGKLFDKSMFDMKIV